MADDTPYDWTSEYAGDANEAAFASPKTVEPGAGLGDLGRNLYGGALSAAHGASALMQYQREGQGDYDQSQLYRGIDLMLGSEEAKNERNISEGAKQARDAGVIPGEGQASVFATPVSSLAMKLTSAAVPIAVMGAFPGGLVGTAVAGGTMQAMEVAKNAVAWSDAYDDAELKKEAPTYRVLRDEKGMDEGEARAALHRIQVSGIDMFAHFATGMATMGGAGGIIRKGFPGATALRRIGGGAAIGGAEMGLAGADIEAAQEQGEEAVPHGGGKPKDFHAKAVDFINRTFEGALLAGGAAAFHGKPGEKKKPDVEVTDPNSPAADQALALDTAQDPNGDIQKAKNDAAMAAVHKLSQDAVRKSAEMGAPSGEAMVEGVTGAPAAPPAAPVTPEGTSPSLADVRRQQASDAASRVAPAAAEPAVAAEAPAPAPVAGPGPSTADAAAAVDRVTANKAATEKAGETQQEPAAQLEAQQQQTVNGDIPAQFYPRVKGKLTRRKVPEGMEVVTTPKGTYHFNPKLTDAAEVRAADKSGDTNKILGLGDHSIKDVAQESIKTGEPPQAVQQVTAEGTPVREALAAGPQVAETKAVMEKTVPPGGDVRVVEPAAAVEQRATAKIAEAEALIKKIDEGKAKHEAATGEFYSKELPRQVSDWMDALRDHEFGPVMEKLGIKGDNTPAKELAKRKTLEEKQAYIKHLYETHRDYINSEQWITDREAYGENKPFAPESKPVTPTGMIAQIKERAAAGRQGKKDLAAKVKDAVKPKEADEGKTAVEKTAESMPSKEEIKDTLSKGNEARRENTAAERLQEEGKPVTEETVKAKVQEMREAGAAELAGRGETKAAPEKPATPKGKETVDRVNAQKEYNKVIDSMGEAERTAVLEELRDEHQRFEQKFADTRDPAKRMNLVERLKAVRDAYRAANPEAAKAPPKVERPIAQPKDTAPAAPAGHKGARVLEDIEGNKRLAEEKAEQAKASARAAESEMKKSVAAQGERLTKNDAEKLAGDSHAALTVEGVSDRKRFGEGSDKRSRADDKKKFTTLAEKVIAAAKAAGKEPAEMWARYLKASKNPDLRGTGAKSLKARMELYEAREAIAKAGDAAKGENLVRVSETVESAAEREATKIEHERLAKEIVESKESLPSKIEESAPLSDKGVAALKARLERILDKARESGIVIPGRSGEHVSDSLLYLRTVKELHDRIKGETKGNPVPGKRIMDFMGDEIALRSGDPEMMRELRKISGEVASGNVGGEEARSYLNDDPHDHVTPKGMDGKNGDVVKDGETGNTVRAVQSTTASKIFSKLRATGTKGIGAKLRPLIVSHLNKIVGDTPVHIMTEADMIHMLTKLDGTPPPDHAPKAWFDGKSGHIVIREDVAAHPELLAHTVIHETVHAAMDKALLHNPLLLTHVKMIRDAIDAHLTKLHGPNWDQLKELKYAKYAIRNLEERPLHEFMSESLSNEPLQDLMMGIKAPDEVVPRYNMAKRLIEGGKSVWDRLVGLVREELGLPNTDPFHSALEGVLRASADITRASERHGFTREGRSMLDDDHIPSTTELFRDKLPKMLATGNAKEFAKGLIDAPAASLASGVRGLASRVADTAKPGGLLHRIGRAVETWEQFGQRTDHLFASGAPRAIRDLAFKAGAKARKLKEEGNDIAAAMIRLHQRKAKVFEGTAQLFNDATARGFDPSSPIGEGRNAWLAPSQKVRDMIAKGATPAEIKAATGMHKWEAMAHAEDLTNRYNALVKEHPDVKHLMESVFSFFEKSQTAQGIEHVRNTLKGIGFKGDVESEAKALLNDKNTAEWREAVEKEHGKEALGEIVKARRLLGGEGPYSPLMRRGDFVIHGDYHVEEPKNAINKVGDDTWEFKGRDEAEKFASDSGLHFDAKIVRYDPETGERTTKEGGISHGGTGPGTAEERYAVTLQRKHVEYFEKRAEAEARRKELLESGVMKNLSEVVLKDEIHRSENELTSAGVRTILRKMEQTDAYKAASDDQRAAMKQALVESSMALQAGNRIQSRRLPRRRVGGASTDMIQNMIDYNESQAHYLAKLEYRPQIEEALLGMKKEVDALSGSKGYADKSDVYQETAKRARAENPDAYNGKMTEWTRRMGMYSYVDRMARPSHLILHQTHLPMITAPIIMGRHGLAATYGMMLRTWRQVGGSAYKAGGKDFAAAVADSLHKGTDYHHLMKEQFKGEADAGRLGKMWDELDAIDVLHPQAAVEVQRYNPTGRGGAVGAADSVMNKIDVTFRHATNATEAINRYVGTAMAYRLEFAKLTREGMGQAEAHKEAVEYTRKIINDTQGIYNGVNAAPLFQKRYLRPFLQFKQFPQMMYNLLIKTAGKIFTGDKQEKLQAAGSLGAIILTHSMMTGALGGIPTEPLKVLGMITKGLGLTEGDWSDVERAGQLALAKQFGPEVANLIAHGLSAKIGADLHHRAGMNSYLTFGLPDEPSKDSVSSFLLHQIAGAPYGLAEDAFVGGHKMLDGDMAGGLAKALPLQMLRDVHKAWTGGPKETPYTARETATRLLGFTPTSEAEGGAERRLLSVQKKELGHKVHVLTQAWVDADATSKGKAWAKIQKLNEELPSDAKITMGQLTKLARRQKAQASDPHARVAGVNIGKREQRLADEARILYPH